MQHLEVKMKTEQSIVLQKKMILFLSLVIMSIFSIVYYRENAKIKLLTENIKEVEQANSIITVERQSDDEIERKTIKYLMAPFLTLESNNGDFSTEILADVTTNNEKLLNNKEESVANTVTDSKSVSDVIENTGAPTHNIQNLVFDDENVDFKKDEVLAEEVEVVNAVYHEKSEGKGIPDQYSNVIQVTATAYCLCKSCCGKNPTDPYYGYTASGLKIVPGTGMKVIAVDPNVIPLNTNVYVEGLNGAWDYGYAIAADTGGAIKNQKIDLYMDSHADALKWGRRQVKVYLLNQ